MNSMCTRGMRFVVIAAMLSGRTLEEAANYAEISVDTLRSWREREDFQAEYKEIEVSKSTGFYEFVPDLEETPPGKWPRKVHIKW